MDFKPNENNLGKSGYSYLENSQFLYQDSNNQISTMEQQNYHQQLQNQLNKNNNQNQKYHFEYSGQSKSNNPKQLNQSFNMDNINNITFGNTNKFSLDNSITNIPLSKTQVINPRELNPLERSQLINQKGISLEKSTLFNSELQDLSKSITIKKKNLLLTKSPYVGFVNNFGDNSCYVNVVLHLLYCLTDINNILKDIYSNEAMENENQKDNIDKTKLNSIETPNKEELLIKFGELLSLYDCYKDRANSKMQVTVIDNKELRQALDKYSSGIFALDFVADPVELLLYLLDILNRIYPEQIHKNFYLNLVDKINCAKNCSSSKRVRFDKDNFSYHIYVDELLNFIRDEGIKFKDSKENLFSLSLDLFKNEIKFCDKCSLLYDKYLFCFSEPNYLLINCVWKNQVPEQKDILDFLFLLSLEDDLKSLFMSKNTTYQFLGMILYSYSLCHYTVLLYNKKYKVFAFHNDDVVMEYQTIYDFFSEILINNINIYDNDKAYFYPTMLIYTKESIYDNNDIKMNQLNDFKYVTLTDKIEKTKESYIKRHTLTEEQKKKNLEELIQKQKEYDQMMNNQYKINNEEKKNEIQIMNNIDNNIDENDNNINMSKNKNQFNNNMNGKITGNDLLSLSGNQNILSEKNLSSQFESSYSVFNNKSNFNNISFQSDFLKDIKEQSNEKININNKNNPISSQRIEMKNDINEFNDNNILARTQMIPDVNYFDRINQKSKNNNTNQKPKNNINYNTRQNNRINMSQQINNNNIYQSFNEQNNLNNYKDLGKSYQNIGSNYKK